MHKEISTILEKDDVTALSKLHVDAVFEEMNLLQYAISHDASLIDLNSKSKNQENQRKFNQSI